MGIYQITQKGKTRRVQIHSDDIDQYFADRKAQDEGDHQVCKWWWDVAAIVVCVMFLVFAFAWGDV